MPPGPKASSRSKQQQTENVAGAYLALLADRGVEYLFGNAGTDFAPIVEAYAQAAQTGVAVPRPMLATHENLAVDDGTRLRHGIPADTGGDGACQRRNRQHDLRGHECGARERAILLTAGRSPLTETGLPGSRDGYIHWAQEMYDQAGMIREIVKWDYELRNAEQLTTVVDRALAIAATEPRGPVTSPCRARSLRRRLRSRSGCRRAGLPRRPPRRRTPGRLPQPRASWRKRSGR